jgi:uncharacterized protein (DUF1697 family)
MANQVFLALLRGVNVGGNATVGMAALKSALSTASFTDVRSYINSGNLIFSSSQTNTGQLALEIETVIAATFGFHVDVAVFTQSEWTEIITAAPKWWGHDDTRKHNLLVMLRPSNMDEVMNAIGAIKPGIESDEAGKNVVYQSLSLKDFGKTTTGKLASNPIYKQMTIRNYNTATKLLTLFEGAA